MQRGPRGSGVLVDPLRVRAARQEAGLSLAQVAGDDVSRTFLLFVEQGRSRPSLRVLSLIARRTGRPVSYFAVSAGQQIEGAPDLASTLLAVAGRVRRLGEQMTLSKVDHEAIKLLEVAVRQGAQLVRVIEDRSEMRTKRPRLRALPKTNKKAS
jgi:transcriptional regulator with XRE-family HTH domain